MTLGFPPPLTRRDLLRRSCAGVGLLGLASTVRLRSPGLDRNDVPRLKGSRLRSAFLHRCPGATGSAAVAPASACSAWRPLWTPPACWVTPAPPTRAAGRRRGRDPAG